MKFSKLTPFIVGAVCLLLGLGPWLLATPSTQQTVQQRRQNDLELRQLRGDLSAMHELYSGGYYPTETSRMYVALEGAALGDEEFQRIYSAYFERSVAREDKLKRVSELTKQVSGPYAQCFFEQLAGNLKQGECARKG